MADLTAFADFADLVGFLWTRRDYQDANGCNHKEYSNGDAPVPNPLRIPLPTVPIPM